MKNKRGNFFNSSKDNAGGYGGNIYDTFLNIKNPLIIDANNASYNAINFDGKTKSTDGWVSEAKSRGFDGVIFNNIRDGVDFGSLEHATNDYVAFNSNQIKSATDNVGTYSENPDIRWSVRDTPKEFKETINFIVSEIENIKKNNLPTDTKSLERRYAKYDSEGNKILDLKVAKLNDKQVKYFGLEDGYVYTSLFDILDHHFNHHPELSEEAYFNLPNVIGEADIVAYGSVKNSYIFGKYLDKLHIATNVIDIKDKKVFLYKNLYVSSKNNFFKNKAIIKELSQRVVRQSTINADSKRTLTGDGNISSYQRDNLLLQSSNSSENQEKNSTSLKALLRQERSENPVVWASIILAREILQNRPITQSKLEKVLPSAKFDGTKRQYAIDRAKQIAEHCKATQENYRERLDEAVQLAEIDVYWNREVMQEAYNSFRRDGEEYGIAKQKLLDWLKKEQQKDLDKVKGLSAEELGMDVSGEIENALEKEPERKNPEEQAQGKSFPLQISN